MSIKSIAVAATCAVALLALTAPLAQALTKQEEANLKLAVDFEREVLQARNPAAAPKFYAPDIKQHNPNVGQGLAGFQEFFGKIFKSPLPVKPEMDPKADNIVVQGDLVVMTFKHATPEPSDPSKTYDSYSFDMYRVKDGKIVEHWDGALKPTPKP
jgi:predicted SnoaL-like aldol condensation-catalyzing enzyme